MTSTSGRYGSSDQYSRYVPLKSVVGQKESAIKLAVG